MMNKLFILLLLIKTITSKLAYIENHQIDEITAKYKLKETMFNGTHYTGIYNNNKHGECLYSIKHDDLETVKNFVYSNECKCCLVESLKYPSDEGDIDDSVFPLEFIFSEEGKALFIITFIFSVLSIIYYISLFFGKEGEVYHYYMGVCVFIGYTMLVSMLVIEPYVRNQDRYKYITNYNLYELVNIVMKDNYIRGVYKYLNEEVNIDFCRNVKDLLACGYSKQYISLDYDIYSDGVNNKVANFSNINYTMKLFDTFFLIYIILCAYPLFNLLRNIFKVREKY